MKEVALQLVVAFIIVAAFVIFAPVIAYYIGEWWGYWMRSAYYPH